MRLPKHSRRRAGRMEQRELPYAGWEALRLAMARRRLDLIERANLSPALRRMLLAIHTRCGGKRWCWPSERLLSDDLLYLWPQSRRTVQRQLKQLQDLGLLFVEQRCNDTRGQSSSIYAIRYGALRHYTLDAASSMTRGGGTCTAGGRHLYRGGAAPVPPLECNRKQSKETQPLPNRTQTRTVVEPFSRTRVDGVGILPRKQDPALTELGGVIASLTGTAMPASWATRLTPTELSDRTAQQRLWREAIAAGWLEEQPINLVRFVALIWRARRDASLTHPVDWLLKAIETRAWHWLTGPAIQFALANVSEAKHLSPLERAMLLQGNR